jgi:hypothetical protein
MAKASSPPPPPPTQEQINRAATSSFMSDLVAVAKAFGRAGINAPFTVALPQLVQGWVKEKDGYRKISIKAGAKFDVERITLGKKAGLLFCFVPKGEPVADKDNPAWIELEWDDVINAFGDLADDVDQRLAPITVANVNGRLKDIIKANAGMHRILMGGFAQAFTNARDQAQDDELMALPGAGMF